MRASSLLVGGWWAQLATSGRTGTVTLPAAESPDWDALEEDASQLLLRLARTTCILLAGMVCLGWLVETMTLTRAPELEAAFTHWRLSVIAIAAGAYVTLSSWRAAQRFPLVALAPFLLGATAVLTRFLSTIGGLEQPWFLMTCALPIVTSLAPLPIPKRAGLLVGLDAALLLGFFGTKPSYAADPRIVDALIFLGTLTMAGLLIGHIAYVGYCHRFFQGLSIERGAMELEALNSALNERVRERTAELRRLAEHLQVVQEDERGRIARELHDELGQRLSALRYVLVHARQRFARTPAAIGPNLDEIDRMIAGALDCTRDIVSGLRPPLLDQIGLAATIEWLARRMSDQAGLACDLDLGDDEGCDPAVSVAAYRVVQESVTNVTRHARATRIAIRLRVSKEDLSLEVSDDGCGFPEPQGNRPTDRNGLLGMRERALALGGRLDTDNAPDGGARVRLRLPMAPLAPAVPS
jgi:signal transduction histidine kinase